MAASSLPVLAAVVAATAATTLDALPERIDVTSVLAAYGAGAVLGEAITVHEVEAQRRSTHGAGASRRWPRRPLSGLVASLCGR